MHRAGEPVEHGEAGRVLAAGAGAAVARLGGGRRGAPRGDGPHAACWGRPGGHGPSAARLATQLHQRVQVLAEGEGGVRRLRWRRREAPEDVAAVREEGAHAVGGRLAQAGGGRLGGGAPEVVMVVVMMVAAPGSRAVPAAAARHGRRQLQRLGLVPGLVRVVDEVAAGAVGAEADAVEGAAQLRLVLGVAHQTPELVGAVRELALVAVLAGAVLLKGPAQLRLVAARVDVGGLHGLGGGGCGGRRRRGGFALGAVQLAMVRSLSTGGGAGCCRRRRRHRVFPHIIQQQGAHRGHQRGRHCQGGGCSRGGGAGGGVGAAARQGG